MKPKRWFRRPYMMETVVYSAFGIPHDPEHETFDNYDDAEMACFHGRLGPNPVVLFERNPDGDWEEVNTDLGPRYGTGLSAKERLEAMV